MVTFVCLFFLLSAVSSAEVSITNETTGGIKAVLDTPFIEKGVIKLANGTYSGANNTNLNIYKNVTIKGSGNTILDAESKGRHFIIEPKITVTFMNLIFINGNSTLDSSSKYGPFGSYGGSLFVNSTDDWLTGSTLIVKDCTFINNQAEVGGGAISAFGSLYVDNCIFKNNFCNELNTRLTNWNAEGGAISYWSGSSKDSAYEIPNGECIIIDSVFINNYVMNKTDEKGRSFGGSGGAISIQFGPATIKNCSFYDNYAYSGGAIYSGWWSNHTLLVYDSYFENNTAQYQGGAICAGWNGDFEVYNSTFVNNTVYADAAGDGIGGALAIYGYSVSGSSDDSGWLRYAIVKNCTFIGNKATSYGGAIIGAQINNITVEDCYFYNNTCNRGSAITMEWMHYLLITNCLFDGNEAKNSSTLVFYGMPEEWNAQEAYYVTGNTFINNKAPDYVIMLVYRGNVYFNYNRIVSDCDTFINNTNKLWYAYSAEQKLADLNIDYNWWGDNSNPNSKFENVTANNWFVIDVINTTSLDSNGTVSFSYTMKLNTDESFDDLLPYFVTDVFANGKLVTSFDARYDNLFNVITTTDGKTVYGFNTDYELITLEGTVTIPETPVDPVIPDDDPVIPDDDPVPDDPETPDDDPDTIDDKDNNTVTASASMKETGIPIIAILLVIMSLIGAVARKK